MTDQLQSGEDSIDAMFDYAMRLANARRTRRQIEDALQEKGLTPDAAATFMAKLRQARLAAMRVAGKRNVIVGSLWCAGGIVVTLGTSLIAGPEDTYLIAWGAIFFGGLQVLRGFLQML